MSAALSLLPSDLATRLVPAHRLEEKRRFLASGLPDLDALLAGGWPRGALSEIAGRRGAGRTAVACASLGAAQRAGETVALIDVGGTLDARAAESAGIALDRLLWIRATPQHALKATDLLVSAGGFGLLILDLGDERHRSGGSDSGGEQKRASPLFPTAAWVRLSRTAEKQGTAVLVSTPRRKLGTFAAAAIALEACGGCWDGDRDPRGIEPRLVLGVEARAALVRARTRSDAPPSGQLRLTFPARG